MWLMTKYGSQYGYFNDMVSYLLFSSKPVKKNFVDFVRERTMPTERPPLAG
jgi:hypothetical protein